MKSVPEARIGNDERFSFLTILVDNNYSDVSTRCSSPPQGDVDYVHSTYRHSSGTYVPDVSVVDSSPLLVGMGGVSGIKSKSCMCAA